MLIACCDLSSRVFLLGRKGWRGWKFVELILSAKIAMKQSTRYLGAPAPSAAW
jgi:hypothetical protein